MMTGLLGLQGQGSDAIIIPRDRCASPKRERQASEKYCFSVTALGAADHFIYHLLRHYYVCGPLNALGRSPKLHYLWRSREDCSGVAHLNFIITEFDRA
jgi:hypothetical protein